MKKLLHIVTLMCVLLVTGCGGGDKKPTVDTESISNDTVFEQPKNAPKTVSNVFGGDLANYYLVSKCTATLLTNLDLEAMNIVPKDDCHYYKVSIGLEKNDTPFDFPVDKIECMYDVWLVPTKFPDGKFNVHAQVLDIHNTKVAKLDFRNVEELKNLLKKCPNEGDFLILEDVLEIERIFDRPTNKLDIRGYIKPVK